MLYPKLQNIAPAARRPDLTLLPLPDMESAVARAAAQARVRHAVARGLDEFLDRSGFIGTDGPPPPALAAALGRACWTVRGEVGGLLAGADGAALIDLLERGLLLAIQGAVLRAADEIGTLGADLERIKYLRLPVRRVRHDAPELAHIDPSGGLPGGAEARILERIGEPVLWTRYAPDSREDGGEVPGPALREARLLLPGVGLVAAAEEHGAFHFDLGALTRFVCQADVAMLARP